MESAVKTLVKHIPYAANEKELITFLEASVGPGSILSATIKVGREHGRSIGQAIVHFKDQDSALKAVKLADYGTLKFQNRKINIQLVNRDILHKPKHDLITIELGSLYLGYFKKETTVLVLWSSSSKAVSTNFDFSSKKVIYTLSVDETTEYKLEFHFEDIFIEPTAVPCNGNFAFLMQVQNPPRVFQRAYCADDEGELDANCQSSCLTGMKEKQWARSTDFTPNSSIGHAWAYLLECPDLKLEGKRDLFKKIADYKLAQHPIHHRKLKFQPGVSTVTRQTLVPIVEAPEDMHIAFELMFKVNELVHYGKLNPADLNREFYKILQPRCTPHEYAKLGLREILEQKSAVCWNPVRVFYTAVQKHQRNRVQTTISGSVKLERSLLSVHRLAITPTKVYCYGPEVDLSNRVTRKFRDDIDNFLRVSFIEEDWEDLSANALTTGFDNCVYDRFLRVMREGVQLGGKKYEFLAFSSSQLRERSFWMFASTGDITPSYIREWMGDFLSIRNVAQCAARMGQCFSSSTPTLEVPSQELELIDDVERVNRRTSTKYCFSDGIGKISKEFANQVGRKFGLRRMGVFIAPSAFQIRYGGYKGVVAVDPYSSYKLSLRPSMRKFTSDHIGLEVLGWAQFLPCYLNRQIISLLSTLGIADHVFENLQERVVTQLDAMIEDPVVALEVLQATHSGDSHRAIKKMLEIGYHPTTEPYLKSMLTAFRAYQLLNLRTKTRIFVPTGAVLMGCLDEIAVLEYGEVFLQLTPASGSLHQLQDGLDKFPKHFHGDKKNIVASVVTGQVVVAKNPCLHPGDVRVLQAVDHPGLRHMVNCLVFPQKGRRPHPDECSGSDLDGDLYFVSWDRSLIPLSMDEPMDYTPAPKTTLDHPVTVEELQEFFLKHWLNDNLGQISNAHVVHADHEPQKARSTKCKELAKLFSIAVDFSKTGVPAVIPHNLRPKEYPDFMEKEDKTTYRSECVIGKLFRSVREAAAEKVPDLNFSKEFMSKYYDKQLQVNGFEDYVEEALAYKNQYDVKLIGLMNQYGIETEAELMGGNILRLSRHFRKRVGEVKRRIDIAVNLLKREAREWFFGPHDDEVEEEEAQEERWVVDHFAKASAWYYVTYHPNYFHANDQFSAAANLPLHLLSFPWVVSNVLFRIKAN